MNIGDTTNNNKVLHQSKHIKKEPVFGKSGQEATRMIPYDPFASTNDVSAHDASNGANKAQMKKNKNQQKKQQQ